MSEGELVNAIRGFYNKPGNECGGVLHIALDDGNLSDDNLLFCMAEAKEANDTHAFYLAEEIMKFPYEERLEIYRWGYRYWSVLY